MTKNVVYILGAGFSAPVGVPTMRNFIDQARKLRRGNESYAYFDRVIKLVQDTVSAATFFQHDSRNIEEALSLLEMKDSIEGTNQKDDLIRFIVEVIRASTPIIPQIDMAQMPSNFHVAMFTQNLNWQGYCSFLASMCQLEFRRMTNNEFRGLVVQQIDNTAKYSILTLNYDLILENTCRYLLTSFQWGPTPKIHFNSAQETEHDGWPQLVKIHGSVDTGNIIPPTFNKGLYGSELPHSWREAYDILARANEIRIIGYSLPQTDSYIKYLLMASVDRFKDLDRIDWIVRDARNEVHERYNRS